MAFNPSTLTDEQLAAAQAEQMARRAREQQEAQEKRSAALKPLVDAGLTPALVAALEAAEFDPVLRDQTPHIRAALTGVKALVKMAGSSGAAEPAEPQAPATSTAES